ncbi:hypothetical protein MKHDV_02558 [Halodesulfovibrio sp. MK-HDV]|nr:hypothetical protein MKHDV_02558 [Halodesulfovibrio sp. MK-HDV]
MIGMGAFLLCKDKNLVAAAIIITTLFLSKREGLYTFLEYRKSCFHTQFRVLLGEGFSKFNML